MVDRKDTHGCAQQNYGGYLDSIGMILMCYASIQKAYNISKRVTAKACSKPVNSMCQVKLTYFLYTPTYISFCGGCECFAAGTPVEVLLALLRV